MVLAPTEWSRGVDRYQACQNCLGLSHTIAKCQRKNRCHVCKVRHHTLLHCPDERQVEWLQMTAWARLQYAETKECQRLVRVLLDPNAAVSKAVVTSLLFPLSVPDGLKYIKLQLADHQSGVRTPTAKFEVVRGPSPFTPHRRCVSNAVRQKYGPEELVDHSFNLPYGCCLVLGADVAKKVYLRLPQSEAGVPYAQNTIFGWTMFGPINAEMTLFH